MIRSFKDRRTAALFRGETVAAFRAIEKVAHRKLDMLDGATRLTDLAAPPGNRLEALRSDRAGQHSIRINDQWRLCFVWRDGGAELVEIVDYH
ncbi:MAG TPA: type II toxin-antitoxin system RelE/ParE family toxin [Stellaceae bacterium]